MNEVIEKEKITVENMIYEIKGKQVMLDSDLAKLYGLETKRVNEAVKNNLDKFPERFSWILTDEEYYNLRSKISTSSLEINHGGRRYKIRVFTEQGIAMLATVLKSKTATKVSIRIMDAFVAMKKYISNNLLEQKYINNMVLEHDNEIKLLQDSFQKFEEKKKANEIFFNGQIFDAYSKIQEIFNQTKSEIIIIDNFADNTLLDIVKRLEVNVTIITKENSLLTNQDILKYNKQYHNLKVIYNNTFHDRYFILDNDILYHCGASINKIGYKTFSINLINDKFIIKILFDRVDQIING